jgi:hypothetical protein
MAIAPGFSDERLLLAIKEVEESNPVSLGVVYTDYEYRFALAIADAKVGSPPNFALYTDCEYRFGAAIADVRTGASLRWNLYSPTEVFFAQSIMPLIEQGNTVNIAAATTSNQMSALPVSVSQSIDSATTSNQMSALPVSVSQSIDSATTSNQMSALPVSVSQSIDSANTGAIAATLSFIHPDAARLRQNITAAGSSITDADLLAISNFCFGLITDGLRAPIGSTNHLLLNGSVFAGANLIAATQLLFYQPDLAPPESPTMTVTGFVGGDYTRATGITGNGSSKALLSDFNPTNGVVSLTDISASAYMRSQNTQAASAAEIGSWVDPQLGTTPAWVLWTKYASSETNSFACAGDAASFVSTAIPTATRLITSSRISASNFRLYRQGVQAGSTLATATGSLPNLKTGILGNWTGGSYVEPSPKSMGCFFLGKGLTQPQIAALSARVDTLMTFFGRNV